MLKKRKLLYAEITAEIWKPFRKLPKEFEAHDGFLENQKREALRNELIARGLSVCSEVPMIKRLNGKRVCRGKMDLVVECRVIVEVKNRREGIIQKDIDQTWRYLEGTGMAVGVVLNFGCRGIDLNKAEERRKVFRRLEIPENNPYLYPEQRD